MIVYNSFDELNGRTAERQWSIQNIWFDKLGEALRKAKPIESLCSVFVKREWGENEERLANPNVLSLSDSFRFGCFSASRLVHLPPPHKGIY
jgi:hypothetical protein